MAGAAHFAQLLQRICPPEDVSDEIQQIAFQVGQHIQSSLSDNTLSSLRIHIALKQMRLQRYYEYVPQIIWILRPNYRAFALTSEELRLLTMLFSEVRRIYYAVPQIVRVNFFAYGYLIRKIAPRVMSPRRCAMLEERMPSPRSVEKLAHSDAIWNTYIAPNLSWRHRDILRSIITHYKNNKVCAVMRAHGRNAIVRDELVSVVSSRT